MVKRTRVGTASTLAGDTDVIKYVTATPQQWQYCSAPMPNDLSQLQLEPSSVPQPQTSGIFTVEPPESVEVWPEGYDKIGSLFEQCYYCKSKFKEKEEVYMYSEHAFCKTVCREIQMTMDDMKERLAAAKRKVVN